MNIAKVAHERTSAISKLMQIIFADNHCSRLPQPPHDFGILTRNAILI
jgi:hypothetical protein